MDDHDGQQEKPELPPEIEALFEPLHEKIPQQEFPTEVQFQGTVVTTSRLKPTNVPTIYQSHPLLRDDFFYTVPEQLLKAICLPKRGESFEVDGDLLEMDLALSQISGDHGTRVGFWNNFPIDCSLMRATSLRQEDLEKFGHLNEEQIEEVLRKANERLVSFSEITCGYAGWLMSS